MSVSEGVFKKYLNRIFIETGSCYGDGINQAIDAGFEKIYSIELSELLYHHCCKIFYDNENVILLHGDSSVILSEILSKINEPVTFWLDAHYSGGETVLGDKISPLLEELEAIGKHNIKIHTILIDDLRDWKMDVHGFNVEYLKDKIREINPDYIFVFEDGIITNNFLVPNDILVAKI